MAAHSTTAAPPSADSLERSLRTFSIHDSGRYGGPIPTTTGSQALAQAPIITLDLNSETSLPYNWEQCLDLKTGEIYFINRSNGVKTMQDPREMEEYRGEYYYSDDDEDEEDEEYDDDDDDDDGYETDEEGCGSNVVKGEVAGGKEGEDNVLVAAGCRNCLMYYMVPKQVNDCPKCKCQLLHFDRLEKPSSLAAV